MSWDHSGDVKVIFLARLLRTSTCLERASAAVKTLDNESEHSSLGNATPFADTAVVVTLTRAPKPGSEQMRPETGRRPGRDLKFKCLVMNDHRPPVSSTRFVY